MLKIMLVILLSVFVIYAFASYSPQSILTSATVVEVYDGDTIFVDFDGVPDIFGKRIGIRLAGIDTPEIRGKCSQEKEQAIKARELLKEMVYNKQVELRNITRGKYFRLIADVYVNNINTAQILLSRELATRYVGSNKGNWCD